MEGGRRTGAGSPHTGAVEDDSDPGKKKKNETQVKKAKGVPGNVVRKDMTFEDWEKVRRGDEHEIVRSFNAFRSIGHEIRLVRLAKRSLSYDNDKVHMSEDGGARPLGHWRNCRAAA